MLDSYFKISERGSSVAQEVRGGLVTFFTMAYIVALNPLILATTDGAGQFIGGGDRTNAIIIVAATMAGAGAAPPKRNYPFASGE